ncbi:MAG: hypothetical protein L0Y56_09005 [Nitrospira sp.]|nr:hypothetical protein [Nitrospira sp.]
MYPSLDSIDYEYAAKTCREIGILECIAGTERSDGQSWQFHTGFSAYKMGQPLRDGMKACFYPASRRLWRLGWLTGLFEDLSGRDVIIAEDEENVL